MYGKFFESTFNGSMVGAGPVVFAVWGYVIAHVRKSRVELNPVLLAAILGTDVKSVESALEYLMSPDPRSRSKDHDGRRLMREGEFQFFVPSHAKYSAMRDEDERREYNRIKKAESRARKADVKLSNGESMTVSQGQPRSAHTDADTDPESESDLHKDHIKDVGKARGTRPTSKTAEQIISECSSNPAYDGIDVSREYGKMATWCKANRKQPTERRFVNWLNRCERPISGSHQRPAPNDSF